MKNKLKLKKQHELFSECRRNFDRQDVRKTKTVEIPSKKDKLRSRARRKQKWNLSD